MTVKWKQGSRFRTDPEVAHAALEALRAQHDQQIEPHHLVEAAEDEEHPLHNEFDWDDSSAAHKWRKRTAGKLIGSIQVIRDEAPHVEARAYEAVRLPAESEEEKPRFVYRTTEDILKDPNARDQLLMDAIRDAAAYRKRYYMLQELAQVFVAMDEVFDRNLAQG